MAQVFELICATSRPGTIRKRSGIFLAPERRSSDLVITKTADAVRESFCSFFETEVTSMFIRSSRLRSARSGVCCCGHAGAAKMAQAAIQNATFVISMERLLRRLFKECNISHPVFRGFDGYRSK